MSLDFPQLLELIRDDKNTEFEQTITSQTNFDINIKNQNGQTLLMFAAFYGNITLINFLLQQGSKTEEVDVSGAGLMHYAAMGGQTILVDYLLRLGIAIDATDTGKHTPLYHAICTENEDFIRKLLREGADVNVKDIRGVTPLQNAVLFGTLDIMGLLLEKGADIYAVDENQNTPYFTAIKLYDTAKLDLLLSAEPNENKRRSIKNLLKVRQLYNVFGSDVLGKKLSDIYHFDFLSGGYSSEAAGIAGKYISKFAAEKKYSANQVSDLLTALKAFLPTVDQRLEYNSQLRWQLFGGGCEGHRYYAWLKQENQPAASSKLIIAERGFFGKYHQQDTSKTSSLRVIMVEPSQDKEELVDLLQNTAKLNENEAQKVLEIQIPELVKSKFDFDAYPPQKAFKDDRCYFENLKSALLGYFIEQFGVNQGKLIYKEFDIYMHEQALQEYCDSCSQEPEFKEIVAHCKEVLTTKKQKFEKLSQNSAIAKNISPDIKLQKTCDLH